MAATNSRIRRITSLHLGLTRWAPASPPLGLSFHFRYFDAEITHAANTTTLAISHGTPHALAKIQVA